MPWKRAGPVQRPSDANTVESPMRKLACITLFSAPGGIAPGGCGPGMSLNRIRNSTHNPLMTRPAQSALVETGTV